MENLKHCLDKVERLFGDGVEVNILFVCLFWRTCSIVVRNLDFRFESQSDLVLCVFSVCILC